MIKSAADYHFTTSYDRFNMQSHSLDWENQPNGFKIYPEKANLFLPESMELPSKSLWELMQQTSDSVDTVELDFNLLAQIFFLTNTLTAKTRVAGGHIYFRSAASAGALYPNEIYLGAYHIGDLEPGIYHYDIGNMALASLRKSNFRGYSAEAFDMPADTNLIATFFITAIFFRSSWKYRARAFRYVLLDAGHVLENLILALKVTGLKFSIHYNFDDQAMGRLIGIDQHKEACLACINVYDTDFKEGLELKKVDSLSPEIIDAVKVSNREIAYDEIQNAYESGIKVIDSGEKNPDLMKELGVEPETWIPIKNMGAIKSELHYPGSVLQRRSKRNFIPEALSYDALMTILDHLCLAANNDLTAEYITSQSVITGFLAGKIEGFEPGFYLLDTRERKTGRVTKDPMVEQMTHICLDQEWLRNASVHFVFLSNLAVIQDLWGPRGYRYAMINAGGLGQAIYVCATSMGLGCCGIGALFDWEARELLQLNDESVLLYLVAAGHIKGG
jgi:SagB-type dehydrogenase family enzyme